MPPDKGKKETVMFKFQFSKRNRECHTLPAPSPLRPRLETGSRCAAEPGGASPLLWLCSGRAQVASGKGRGPAS